jgi:hypothetical protein
VLSRLSTLPPLKSTTQSIYQLEFAPDGFPCRRNVDGDLEANPIYGKYAIQDFLLQADQTGEERYVDAAATVARAAIARMEPHHDGLVFWYGAEQDTKPVRNRARHYSGLTQSHYLVMFQRLAARTAAVEFAAAARRVLQSLLVPAQDGGVLYERDTGTIIAETPLKPNDVVLNGWLTAMLNVKEYADLSGSEQAQSLFDSNLSALDAALPLFDVPELRNSRYGSAGFAYFKLTLPSRRLTATPYRIQDIALQVPGERRYAVTQTEGSRWESWIFPTDLERFGGDEATLANRSVRLNLVLNSLSRPATNDLELTLQSPRGGTALLELWRGGYDPRSAAPSRDPAWVEIGQATIEPGENHLRFPLDWAVADLVAYPTSFLKQVKGKFFNVYHFLHVDQLRRLHDATGDPQLRDYADRWSGYVDEWASMEAYAGVETQGSPHRGHPTT